MRRALLVTASVIIVLVGLGYLAHSMDLVGMITSMHSPPQH